MTPLQHAREMRDEYIAAERVVLKNQSYMIAGNSLTRANLSEIRKGRQEWEAKIAELSGGRRRFRRVIPSYD